MKIRAVPTTLLFLSSLTGCGGGNNSAKQPPPTIILVTPACNPSTLQLVVSGNQPTAQCTAAVQGTGNFNSAVDWAASAGGVSSSGLFTPTVVNVQTDVTITATSVQDASKSGTTVVNVVPPQQSGPPGFTPIPPVTIQGLGQKMTPIDLSLYETGGAAPVTYSLVTQTNPSATSCYVSGTMLTCDYSYARGTNTATVQVVDANSNTAQTNVTVTITIPSVTHKVMWDFSPYEQGQDPNHGITLTDDQLIQRMGAIIPYASILRTFGCTHGLERIPVIAKRFGIPVYVGIWLSRDVNANETELGNCIAVGQAGLATAAVVGSEVLLRGDLTSAQLIDYMNRFRAAVPGIPVTTADIWSYLLNNPDVVNASDIVFVNYYPYWEGKDIGIAVATLNGEDIEMQRTFPGKEIDVSETGWPSCGNTVGNAVPSAENEAFFFLNIASWSQANNRRVFYFEPFDEAWKAQYEGPQGACWGVFDQYAVMKPDMLDTFNGKTIPDNWTCAAPPGGDGTPSLTFTSVPPIDSSDPLLEQEWHAIPANYYIAIYIHVPGSGWWIKPYADQPETLINCDGSASTNIVTGGSDAQADEIAGFLLPSSYSPPIVLGGQSLPADLYSNAVATADAQR
jgi:exo-beta-1,3-glucanase (GH17 family)